MKKITKLSKAAFLVAFSFGINKVLAILRQLLIVRQFGLSSDLDAFNVANNVPEMLNSLITGGALAVAIIPVLSEVITKENRESAWKVFSQIANFAFIVAAVLSASAAIFAWPLVQHPLGIAPGFTIEQQALVVRLMRLNLIGTMFFSMAGLLIAGLQSNQHFLMPAIGPILYNLGQIFGAVVLSPQDGYRIGNFNFPAFGMGVNGLVYGVLIGSALYLLIQIPGLIMCHFKWSPGFNLRQKDVHKILVMLGPSFLKMLFFQLTFIVRDNIASRLPLGSVTALTYGWMIQQVPETLIGTAIGTAVLPTISEHFAKHEMHQFRNTIQRIQRVLISLAIPSALLMAAALPPLLRFAFGFNAQDTDLLLWVTRAFLAGLLGHCLLELGSRVFFAQQNARIPLAGAFLSLVLYILFGVLLSKSLGAPGVALSDSLAFSSQAAFLLITFGIVSAKKEGKTLYFHEWTNILAGNAQIRSTWMRALGGGLLGCVLIVLLLNAVNGILPDLILGLAAACLGVLSALPFIRQELAILFRL